jgi:hypothetical protein
MNCSEQMNRIDGAVKVEATASFYFFDAVIMSTGVG